MGCFKDTKLQVIFRWKGTVIRNIWLRILLIATYTTSLVALHNYVDGFDMNFPQSLIPILGIVTGLLLVFRTNTAYDRQAKLKSEFCGSVQNLKFQCD